MTDKKTYENNDPLEVRNKTQLDFMNTEIVDLFQRNAELLDRLIRLEKLVMKFELQHRGHFHKTPESKSTLPLNMRVSIKPSEEVEE